jgi:hypothetical protein
MSMATTKILTEGRGPLQGVSLTSVIKSAYGPLAEFREDPDGDVPGLIVRQRDDVQGAPAYDVLDQIIELHDE